MKHALIFEMKDLMKRRFCSGKIDALKIKFSAWATQLVQLHREA
jgi:hypothetical protein